MNGCFWHKKKNLFGVPPFQILFNMHFFLFYKATPSKKSLKYFSRTILQSFMLRSYVFTNNYYIFESVIESAFLQTRRKDLSAFVSANKLDSGHKVVGESLYTWNIYIHIFWQELCVMQLINPTRFNLSAPSRPGRFIKMCFRCVASL